MEYEKEVILSIRHRIEVCEQWWLFDNNTSNQDYPLSEEKMFEDSHVHLGSRQRGLKLLSYEKVLEEMLGFQQFGDSLAEFLRDYACVDMYGSDFEGDGFGGHQHYIYWCKVSFTRLSLSHQAVAHQRQVFPHHSGKVLFDCQETAVRKTENFHVSPMWRGSGPRYDSVIIQGSTPSSIKFAQVCGMFSISLAERTFRIIIARTYKKRGRNGITGYIELDGPSDGSFDLYFLESVVRNVHILPPTNSNDRYIVQDLYDGDMYLRLIRS
jgi:hypothetical protein